MAFKISGNPCPEAFSRGEGRKGGKGGEGGGRVPREYPTFATFSIFRGPGDEKRQCSGAGGGEVIPSGQVIG
jgi:hypothetical protein